MGDQVQKPLSAYQKQLQRPSEDLEVVLHPRGFMSLSDPFLAVQHLPEAYQRHTAQFDWPKQNEGNKRVEELYKLWISRSVNINSWRFRKRVIGAASELFGDFKTWISVQARMNDYLYGMNFDFLVDTWQYIHTGRRKMSPLTWKELLEEHQPARTGVGDLARMENFDLSTIQPNEVIGQWCSHNNGFGDMICTLHVLFGVARAPISGDENQPT